MSEDAPTTSKQIGLTPTNVSMQQYPSSVIIRVPVKTFGGLLLPPKKGRF